MLYYIVCNVCEISLAVDFTYSGVSVQVLQVFQGLLVFPLPAWKEAKVLEGQMAYQGQQAQTVTLVLPVQKSVKGILLVSYSIVNLLLPWK